MGKWKDVTGWYGTFVENAVQGAARDILAAALVRLDAAGFAIIAHVHDEVIIEVPEGEDRGQEFLAILLAPPRWADGLPLAAKGWTGQRFIKSDRPQAVPEPPGGSDEGDADDLGEQQDDLPELPVEETSPITAGDASAEAFEADAAHGRTAQTTISTIPKSCKSRSSRRPRRRPRHSPRTLPTRRRRWPRNWRRTGFACRVHNPDAITSLAPNARCTGSRRTRTRLCWASRSLAATRNGNAIIAPGQAVAMGHRRMAAQLAAQLTAQLTAKARLFITITVMKPGRYFIGRCGISPAANRVSGFGAQMARVAGPKDAVTPAT
jgi:hypothetical protein